MKEHAHQYFYFLHLLLVKFLITFALFPLFRPGPSGPPQRVQGDFTSSTSIMVKWDVVREDQQHGEIISYTVRYKKLTDGTYKDKEVTSRSYELKRLDKYTVYKIEVLASTRIGNGPPSEPIEERTDQDSK